MAAAGKRAILRIAAGVLAAGALTLYFAPPASAENIFERIFSGLRRAVEPQQQMPESARGYADPSAGLFNTINPPRELLRGEAGPSKAFCVRTCDGRFFPVQAHGGVSAAESCRSFCPASQTRLFSGGNIDYAVANDGSRYADLANAFVYRKQLVAGCTCNGRDAFGLARVDVTTDATLRPGDVVATKSGLMAFTGAKNKTANFTPVDSSRDLPKSAREKLADVKVSGAAAPAATGLPPGVAPARDDDRRRVQLER
jgi:Protein of unknown function (DUF2865)